MSASALHPPTTLNSSPPDHSHLSPHSAMHIDTGSSPAPLPDSPSSGSDRNLSSVSPTLSVNSFSGKSASTFESPGDNRQESESGESSSLLSAPRETGYKSWRRWSVNSSDGGASLVDSSLLSSLDTAYTKSYGTITQPTLNPLSSIVTRTSHGRKGKAIALGYRDDVSSTDAPSPFTPRLHPDLDGNTDVVPFSFSPVFLASVVDLRDLDALTRIGGEEGLLRGLGTHKSWGLDKGTFAMPGGPVQEHNRAWSTYKVDDVPNIIVTLVEGDQELPREQEHNSRAAANPVDVFSATLQDRWRVYGRNVIPQRKNNSLLHLMWTAMQDKILILLSIAAVVSLALGILQDFGPGSDPTKPRIDWVEGVAIIVAIVIVVMVGSLNDWQKEAQFKKLSQKREERGVKVIRDGVENVVDIKDVLVGDVALLEPGEIIPCDGVFLSGHNVKCDESGATGESDAVRKVSYRDCMVLREQEEHLQADCFLISGSKVLEGYGSYVVVAVGVKSFNGRILMALRADSEITPLQIKLNRLAELIARIGTAVGLLLFVVLAFRFLVQLWIGESVRTPGENGIVFTNIIIIAITLIVVAVPEGLPLAVTLALAFATRRMTEENLLVRNLGSCETMANASVVCTDKTGTLTQNKMSVVAGSIGIHAKFVKHPERRGVHQEVNKGTTVGKFADDFSFDQSDINSTLTLQLKKLLNDGIAVNSTAFEDINPQSGAMQFVGSKTETALLSFAKELGWDDYRKTRERAEIVQMIPFSSGRKAMGIVMRLPDGRWRLHLKGASEILVMACTRHVVVPRPGSASFEGADGGELKTAEIDQAGMVDISRTIIVYGNRSLRTIALCYRDFESWPPNGVQLTEDHEVAYEDLCHNLILIGIVGIEDPLRPGVVEAVATCRKAGVCVKMCTGDNVLTARSIARQCGIYTAGGIIMQGSTFRQLDDKDRLEVVPRLQVLARSSPEDKKMLVETLKALGEIVGVTGDGTNDGPALKAANVGFSMGISGTETAKEASDIIVMDDNFASIVKAIVWGRCVNNAVRKFLQFQISTNIAVVMITFVSAIASVEEESVLGAVQLLWINIVMDTFAALALATDPASPDLLEKKPESLDAPLFSVDMIKMILGQSIYQVIVTLVLCFCGRDLLGLDYSKQSDLVIQTLVFNTFVFAQISNSLNCRGLDTDLNVLRGVTKNWYFILITIIEILAQVLIVFVGGAPFQVTRIGAREWGISLALGGVPLLLGALIRLVPVAPCERLFIVMGLISRPELLPTKRIGEWNPAIDRVRDNLWMFASLRGGRVHSSSLVFNTRKTKFANQEYPVNLPSLMTMVPSLVASSVGAGWAPSSSEGLSDSAEFDPSESSTALWEGKIEIHPDTQLDDPAFKWLSSLARQA